MGEQHNLPGKPSVVDPGSLNDFSNGIFAFAATLLIINITLPPIPPEEAEFRLPTELIELWPKITSYIISFISINGYWRLHSFILLHINRVDNGFALLNSLLLLSVTFLPFPTTLMGQYGKLPIIASFYGATLSVNYLFLFLTAFYAHKHRLGKQELPIPLKLLKQKLALPLIIAIVGTGFSFFYPRFSFLFYTAVVLTHLIPIKEEVISLNKSDTE